MNIEQHILFIDGDDMDVELDKVAEFTGLVKDLITLITTFDPVGFGNQQPDIFGSERERLEKMRQILGKLKEILVSGGSPYMIDSFIDELDHLTDLSEQLSTRTFPQRLKILVSSVAEGVDEIIEFISFYKKNRKWPTSVFDKKLRIIDQQYRNLRVRVELGDVRWRFPSIPFKQTLEERQQALLLIDTQLEKVTEIIKRVSPSSPFTRSDIDRLLMLSTRLSKLTHYDPDDENSNARVLDEFDEGVEDIERRMSARSVA